MSNRDGSSPSAAQRLSPAADAAAGGSHPALSLTSLRSTKASAYYRTLARLGLQAAEALDYAHRAGVVHRDIKPANLLLDKGGNLWVTDFGLAQFYSDNGLTQTGDLLGTLRYMSPEQASGRAVVLDQRTDVYSLGVTLYELITLERALPGETREQLLAQIGSYDPRPARAINRAIPAELETILDKATAKEPADRYASAGAFAADLRRFLQDEPILARPPSAWDQLIKWTRRHKSLALFALVVLVLAAVGFFVSTLLIAAEQRRTRAAYLGEFRKTSEAARERASAQRSFGQARDLVNFLSRVAADELAGSPESAEVRKEMLEAALDYYQGFVEEGRGNAAVAAQLAEAQSYVSRILAELSAFSDFDRVDTSARLLSEPSVREALKLTADQITRSGTIRNDVNGAGFPGEAGEGGQPGEGGPPGPADGRGDGGRTGGRDRRRGGAPGEPPEFRNMTEEEKQQRFTTSARHLETELNALLTPRQAERLKQISRQVRAPASFSDSDLTGALALTREQKEGVRLAQAEFRIAMRKAFAPPPRPGPDGPPDVWQVPPEEPGVRRASEQRAAVEKLLAGLTPAQREAWKRLTGEPFTGALILRYRPGDHRGQGPDDHGPGRHGPGGPGNDGPGHDGPGHGGAEGFGPDDRGDDGGPDHNGPGHDGPGGPPGARGGPPDEDMRPPGNR